MSLFEHLLHGIDAGLPSREPQAEDLIIWPRATGAFVSYEVQLEQESLDRLRWSMARLYRMRDARAVLLEALNEAARVVKSEAESLAPNRTGGLRESIIAKVDAPESRGAAAVATIGPDAGFVKSVQIGRRTFQYRPAEIAGIVEAGHVAANGRLIPGTHFMSRAQSATEEIVQRVVAGVIRRHWVNDVASGGLT